MGKLDDAEPFYRRAVDDFEATLGRRHRKTLSSVNNLGVLLQAMGKLEAAEPLYRRAFEDREADSSIHLFQDKMKETIALETRF